MKKEIKFLVFILLSLDLILACEIPKVTAATVEFLFKIGSPGDGDGEMNKPGGVVVDSLDRVYVADSKNHRIQVFDSMGNFLFKFGTSCFLFNGLECVDPDGNGPLELGDGQFNRPLDVAVDSLDRVYVADTDNHRIQVFDSTGNFLFKFGTRCVLFFAGFPCVDPDGSGPLEPGDGQFDQPVEVAIDSASIIYVADTENHRIQVFDPAGNFLLKWGGTFGDGDGQFIYPEGVAVDSLRNNIYVSDLDNNRVQKFDSMGNFLLQWGKQGDGDGQFNGPSGVTVDSSNHIFVADTYTNHRIQVFDSAGNFLLKWGSFGDGDGQFNIPRGVAVDSLNRVYVADSENHRIQVFRVVGLTEEPNTPPLSDAGAGESVDEGTIVTLDGSGSSDPDGDPLTFAWTQTSGPTVTLPSTTVAQPTFTAPELAADTVMTFQLVVNDGNVDSTPDIVDITVVSGTRLQEGEEDGR